MPWGLACGWLACAFPGFGPMRSGIAALQDVCLLLSYASLPQCRHEPLLDVKCCDLAQEDIFEACALCLLVASSSLSGSTHTAAT